MSKRPFITQEDSPNIIIVPTVIFCEHQSKKIHINNDQTDEKSEQTLESSKQLESSSENMSDDSVINISESSNNKCGFSEQCMKNVNKMESRPSWASNYLLSIAESNNPKQRNLSCPKNKKDTLKRNFSKKKTSQSMAPSALSTKRTLQKRLNDESTLTTFKDNLTTKLNPGTSLRLETENETGVKMIKALSKFDETPTKMKILNIPKDLKNVNKQCSNKTGLDKQPSREKKSRTPQQTVKSKVLKKPRPFEKNATTSSLYDLQTLKCKEFYTNYKIPKISDKNKQEAKKTETMKDAVSFNHFSTKAIPVKELGEPKCSTLKSVIKVVDDSKQKLDINFDLRSKLSRRSLNHYFTRLRNVTESMESVPREQRDSLLITVSNDTDETFKDTGKRKLEDIKTPKKKEVKSTSSKFKKIKLVINVICEKSATSSSDTDDEDSLCNMYENNECSNLDLSFLDDFNIEEIVESLNKEETCDLTSIESKENVAKDFSFKDDADEINNNSDLINIKREIKPTGIERSWLKNRDIKLEEDTRSPNQSLISSDITVAENNERNEAIMRTSNQSIQNKPMDASFAKSICEETKVKNIDKHLLQNCSKLVTADLLKSETKQEQHLGSSEVIHLKQHENKCCDTLIVSNISDTLKTAGEDFKCKETKRTRESDELPALLETRNTNRYFNNVQSGSHNNQDSLEINNSVNIVNANNDCFTDLIEENNSETIFAIRKFLETNTSLPLNAKNGAENIDRTSNSVKDTSIPNISLEINHTNCNNNETLSNIYDSKSSKNHTSIDKLDVMQINEIKDVFEIKEMLHKNDIQSNNVQEFSRSNTSNNENKFMQISEILEQAEDSKNNKKPNKMENTNTDDTECNLNSGIIGIKEFLHKIEVEDNKNIPKKAKQEVLGTNKNKNIFSKLPTELTKEVRNGEFEVQKEQTIKNINKNVEKGKEHLPDCTPFLLHCNDLIKKSEIEKLKTAAQNLDEKTEELKISGIVDIKNELDEDGELFQEKCVVNYDDSLYKNTSEASNYESVTKTTRYKQELRSKNCIQADDGLVATSTEHERGSKTGNNIKTATVDSTTEITKHKGELRTENSIQGDNGSVIKTNENERASKTEYAIQTTRHDYVTEIIRHNGEKKTENGIQVDRSVTKTIEHIDLKTVNSNQADNDEYITKSTELKQKFKIESSSKAANDKTGTKITEHKHRTGTSKACQMSTINKAVPVLEFEEKEESDITVDLKETDVYLAKRLEDRMQQYLKKKYTLTSLLHFGAFSKIYECVSENREKYAFKMMDGDKIYRNSKVEYLMKDLQKDVPKENYPCVYLFSGFGFTKHWCILMELYPKNLKQALQENKKSFHINVIQNLSRQLVSAVTLLRHNNIVHTNIKPTHILINSANDQLKLCGFDEAQYKNAIKFGRNIGTMNYRAPEIILGHSADYEMDVWSTALVMYEMATNIQLFPGIEHNDILYKQMWVCGPVPIEIIRQSKYKNEHFHGFTFMRKLKGGKCTLVPYHIIGKHDLVKKYVYLTYKKDWHSVVSYKQKQLDYAKLLSFCQLLRQMLDMDPKQRLPIEFVYADPFFR